MKTLTPSLLARIINTMPRMIRSWTGNLLRPRLSKFTALACLSVLALGAFCSRGQDIRALWHLDEASGSVVVDSSASGSWNGQLQNGVARVANSPLGSGKSVSLDGIDDFISFPAGVVGSLPAGTFSAWVYIRSFPRGNAIIASQGEPDCTHFFLAVADTRKLTAHICGSPSGPKTLTGNLNVAVNSWQLLTFTWDSSNWKLYVNGFLDITTPANQFPPFTSDIFKLGRHEHITGPFMFDGLMDEVRIYNRALSAAEVAGLINKPPVAVNDTGTVFLGQQLTIAVLGNDSDPDGDALTVISVGQPTHGTAIRSAGNTTVTYTPDPEFPGPNSFTYTISDGMGHTASASVNITVKLRPVIIIPGFMASYLDQQDGTRSWPKDVTLKGNPENLQFDEVGDPVNSVSRGLIPSDELLSFSGFYTPELLVEHLCNNGYVMGQTLFIFTYDFRRSAVYIAEKLAERIDAIKAQTLAEKLDIVAHSYGGIVSEQYLSTTSRAANVRCLITLGTPQLGAPELFKGLRYGEAGLFPLNDLNAKRAAHNWPAAFNVMPGKKYFDLYSFAFEDYREEAVNKGPLNFDQWVNFLRTAKEHPTEFYPLKPTDPFPTDQLSQYLVQHAFSEFETQRDNWEKPNGVEVYAIAGYKTSTVGGIKEVDILDDLWGTIRDVQYTPVCGDNTVPIVSAASIKADQVYFAEGIVHRRLIGNPLVNEQVRGLLLQGEGIYANKISRTFQCGKYLVFATKSPVDLLVINGAGQRTGYIADESTVDEISGSDASRFGHLQFVSVPEEEVVTVIVSGRDTGTFTLEQWEVDGMGQRLRTTKWAHIPVRNGATNKLSSYFGAQNLMFQVDTDGNGIPDSSIPPTAQFQGDGGRHNLAVAKSASASKTIVGAEISYTLTVSNAGPDAATGVILQDFLPATVVLSGLPAGFSIANNVLTGNLGGLAVGEVASVELRLMPTQPGILTNTARVRANGIDLSLANNLASVETTVFNNACDALGSIAASVEAARLSQKTTKDLLGHLDHACKELDKGKVKQGIRQLREFQQDVRKRMGRDIPPATGWQLITCAQEIIEGVFMCEVVEELAREVLGLRLPGKLTDELVKELDKACEEFRQGKTKQAVEHLQHFQKDVAKESGKTIPAGAAGALIQAAEEIIAATALP